MDEFLTIVGLTMEELVNINDGELINGCLVLIKKGYEDVSFKDRKDIKFVFAPNLLVVAENLF